LPRDIAGYVKKIMASYYDDVLNHEKKFKKRSKNESSLAVSFVELNQLDRMSASAKGHFDESFLVKQALNEDSKDERVSMMILAAQLHEKPECGFEDLETKISEKILEIDSATEPATMNIDPGNALFVQPRCKQYSQHAVYFSLAKSSHFANKDAKHSNIAKSSAAATFPALKDRDVPPFVQRVDSSI